MKSEDREQARFAPPGKTAAGDTASVMKFYGLPDAFPAKVLAEAKKVAKLPPGNRLDLRKKYIFTCDPVSARDYDDAISFEKDRLGRRVLGVHIADVSHFVLPGGELDREAYKRSTSVYLADRVVPMLPETLSNGICSLVPGEDRLAFSVFMTFDKNGEMVKRKFAKSVIRSQARFTYEQVMAIIGGRKHPKAKLIRGLDALARQLRAARFAQGALDIEIPETEILLDSEGETTGVAVRPYDESHQLIEECMVAANEAVAKELWTRGIRIVARLHEAPDPEKLMTLKRELRGLGIKTGNLENRDVFAKFLASIKKHPLYPTLATMVLRSMKRAVYSSSAIGHFGLSKRYYAHFTSPIRRYPDLTLHRQLASFLEGGSGKVPPKLLAKWAEHATEREEIAQEAERALSEIKKYRLLEERLASRQAVEYDAVIVKCAPFGCFAELSDLAIAGLVHISALSRKYVRYNEYDQTLSVPGGKGWKAGDRMRVKIAGIDIRERKLDLVPCSSQSRCR
ncbi:MAG: VacB/RNase II family 3'-5' exoribonuclease [Kiritimatiellae bacterium]|nr:VacB/RNase II family 3'-5' exoribonuclease [Kiritimatiellia bacterium]